MLAKKENEYVEHELHVKKNKNSYKLRAMYVLTCMRPQSLHNVLFDLLTACSEANFELYPTDQLTYLSSYDKDNIDLIKTVNLIYEILCQIHDEIGSENNELLNKFKTYPSIRSILIDPKNEEEYRPYEDISFERVVEIAAVAMERGPYSARNIGSSEFENDDEWKSSAEYLYILENERLYKEALEFETEDEEIADLNESMDLNKPIHELLDKVSEYNELEPVMEGSVEKSMWEKFKSKFSSEPKSHDVLPDILMENEPSLDGLFIEEDQINDRGIKKDDTFVVESEELIEEELSSVTHVVKTSKWFGNLETKRDTNEKGFYGYVRLFGLFTIKRNIFVERREDIRESENQIHPLIREFSKVDWLTRDGILVAYY